MALINTRYNTVPDKHTQEEINNELERAEGVIIYNTDAKSISVITDSGEQILAPGNNSKSVDSVSDLRNYSSVELNDIISVKGYYSGDGLGGGDFRVIDNVNRKKLSFIPANLQGITGGAMPTPQSGDKFTIRIKVNSLPSSGYVMALGGGAGRLNLSTATPNTSSDFNFTTQGFGSRTSVKKPYSTNEETIFKFGVWYDVVIDLDLVAITSFNIANPFSTHLDVDIEQFSIVGETFLMNEGEGTTITGDNSTVANLINSPAWAGFDIDNGFTLIQSGAITYERIIEDNTVTFYDAGAYNSSSLTDYIQDSWAAIQTVMDSEYQIKPLVPGFHYISQPIVISRPKVWKMASSSGLETTLNAPLNDPSTIKEGTFIFSNLDIDYVVVRYHNVRIEGGCIYTANSLNHTKSAIRYDLTKDIWGADLVKVFIEGKKEELLTTGIGTTGIKIDAENATDNGYLTWGEFTAQIRWCKYGVHITKKGGQSTFQNSFKFDWVQARGCKKFYFIESSSLVQINGICQDAPVLNAEEFGMYAFDINSSQTEFNAFVYDTERKGGDDPNEYRHESFKYSIIGDGVFLGPMSEYYYNRRTFEMYGVAPNVDNLIQAPKTFYIPDYHGVISEHSNALYFAGEQGTVTYKGYEQPTTGWRDANLLPADDVGNPTPLGVSANVTITNPDRLLKADATRHALVYHTIADVPTIDNHFAEIVIDDIPNIGNIGLSKIPEIGLKLGSGRCKAVQIIAHWTSGGTYTKTFEKPDGTFMPEENYFKLIEAVSSGTFNETIEQLIIRIFGYDVNGAILQVQDVIMKTQYKNNLPTVMTHGTQNISGDFKWTDPTKGVILTDRTTATKYRLYIDSGTLNIEAI